MTLERILEVLRDLKLGPIRLETELQKEVAAALTKHGISFAREMKLGNGLRIDFVCQEGIGIECKRSYVYTPVVAKQVRQYAESGHLNAVILFTEKRVDLANPAFEGLPIPLHIVIGRMNWGLAV